MCSKINACYIFVCIFFQICQNVNFQLSQGSVATYWSGQYYMDFVGYLLLFTAVKNFENPLRIDKWVWFTTFLGTVCNNVIYTVSQKNRGKKTDKADRCRVFCWCMCRMWTSTTWLKWPTASVELTSRRYVSERASLPSVNQLSWRSDGNVSVMQTLMMPTWSVAIMNIL